MAVFARPIADITKGSWLTNGGVATNLFAAIDEDPSNDADYVQSSATVNDTYEARLSSVAPAPIDRLHVLNYRVRKSAALGNTRGVTVSLVQGATVIASQSHSDLTIAAATVPLLLTAAQGALITNYADLRVRFVATGIVSGATTARRAVWVTWAQLRVPDSVDCVDDWRARWGFPASVVTIDDVRSWLDANYAENAVWFRRYNLARAVWKLSSYRPMLDQINAGTYALPSHQTIADAAAIVSAKINRFQLQADTIDAEDNA